MANIGQNVDEGASIPLEAGPIIEFMNECHHSLWRVGRAGWPDKRASLPRYYADYASNTTVFDAGPTGPQAATAEAGNA